MTPAERRKVTPVTGKYPSGDERPESYQVRLPKWWCRKHGYPEHVLMSEERDGSLRIEPDRKVNL